jgi:hypothetical protein
MASPLLLEVVQPTFCCSFFSLRVSQGPVDLSTGYVFWAKRHPFFFKQTLCVKVSGEIEGTGNNGKRQGHILLRIADFGLRNGNPW